MTTSEGAGCDRVGGSVSVCLRICVCEREREREREREKERDCCYFCSSVPAKDKRVSEITFN